MNTEQRRRAIAGIYAAIAAINDNSPVTEDERRQHDLLVQRERERLERQQSLGLV